MKKNIPFLIFGVLLVLSIGAQIFLYHSVTPTSNPKTKVVQQDSSFQKTTIVPDVAILQNIISKTKQVLPLINKIQ